MKKILILFLTLILVTIPVLADNSIEDRISLIVEGDMYLAAKFGVKYDVSNRLSMVSTLGANILYPTQTAYSFYAQWHSKQSESSFNVDVNLGIIQGVFDYHRFTEDKYIYMNPGVTMHLSYPVLDQLSLGAQAGMVFMIGYDRGTWGSSLEPYAGITLTYSK